MLAALGTKLILKALKKNLSESAVKSLGRGEEVRVRSVLRPTLWGVKGSVDIVFRPTPDEDGNEGR